MDSLKRSLAALWLFGVAFGYLEAAVVSYLRDLHEPARLRYYPDRSPAELFPLLSLEQVRASGAMQQKTLLIELGREAATLLMLAGAGLAVARNAGQWMAAFAIVFGIWDIMFYVFLKLLLGWPESLFTWDILFLLPVPWVGPVLAPCLVAATMILGGTYYLWLESRGHEIRLGAVRWSSLVLAGIGIIVIFALDYRHIMAGGTPRGFNWLAFLAALAGAVLCFLSGLPRPRRG